MQKNSVSGRQTLRIFPTRHSLGLSTFYICIKKQFYPTWTQNKQYQTDRFQQFEAMISLGTKESENKAWHESAEGNTWPKNDELFI